MLHAWLGFILLLAFYVLTFGIPRGGAHPKNDAAPEKAWEDNTDPMVVR